MPLLCFQKLTHRKHLYSNMLAACQVNTPIDASMRAAPYLVSQLEAPNILRRLFFLAQLLIWFVEPRFM